MSKLSIRANEAAFRRPGETHRSSRPRTYNVFNRHPFGSLEAWQGEGKSWPSQPEEDGLTDDNQFFSTILADSPALLEVAHALRYQIYCRERNFENGDEYPDGLEIDTYDANAIQGVVFHRSTCAAIGTVRIILPKGVAGESFPIEKILRAQSLELCDYVEAARSVEVSRLAISKQFRCRTSNGPTDTSHPNSRKTELALLSLLQFALRQSLKHKLHFWTAVMEPKLLRLLARYGISHRNIGATVEHHGIRQPCYGYIPETLDTMRRVRPDCWELITNDVPPWTCDGRSRRDVSPASLKHEG
jgi:N-acyl amino acid synthase of PEP-CTERM/exosortase system